MRRLLTAFVAGTALFASSTAWSANLTMTYVQAATTMIDWDGINDVDGDGSMTFSGLGDAQSATLSVLCNALDGYTVTFNSSNATGATTGELKNGSNAIGYTASMSTAGVNDATIVTNSLVLNNGSQESVDVNFNGGSDVLPVNASTEANEIGLTITLDSFDGNLKPAGTYTDTITATIALN